MYITAKLMYILLLSRVDIISRFKKIDVAALYTQNFTGKSKRSLLKNLSLKRNFFNRAQSIT